LFCGGGGGSGDNEGFSSWAGLWEASDSGMWLKDDCNFRSYLGPYVDTGRISYAVNQNGVDMVMRNTASNSTFNCSSDSNNSIATCGTAIPCDGTGTKYTQSSMTFDRLDDNNAHLVFSFMVSVEALFSESHAIYTMGRR
jgi:hypothetical protein